jgi:membrane protein required for colicin V production
MNSLDWFLLTPLVLLGIRGFQRGFIKEALSILITIVSLVVSINAWRLVSGPVSLFWETDSAIFGLVCGIFLFLILMIGGTIVAHLIVRFVESTFLTVPDRMLGLGLGLLKGAVVASLILQLLSSFNVPKSIERERSLLYYPVFRTGPFVYDVLKSFIPGAKSFAEKVSSNIPES